MKSKQVWVILFKNSLLSEFTALLAIIITQAVKNSVCNGNKNKSKFDNEIFQFQMW